MLGNQLQTSARVSDLLHALACGDFLHHGFDAHVWTDDQPGQPQRTRAKVTSKAPVPSVFRV